MNSTISRLKAMFGPGTYVGDLLEGVELNQQLSVEQEMVVLTAAEVFERLDSERQLNKGTTGFDGRVEIIGASQG